MHIFKSYFLAAIILPVAIGLGGCANILMGAIASVEAQKMQRDVEANRKPELTQLQIRTLQTRTYDGVKRAQILQIALSVLQDGGYSVATSNTELGLLTASKDTQDKKIDNSNTAFLKGFFGRGSVSTVKLSTTEVTLTATPFGKKVRVRISPHLSTVSTNGTTNRETITEPEFYQNFFTKLEKGLFIDREKL